MQAAKPSYFTFSRTSFIAILLICQVSISHAGWEVSWIDRFDDSGVNWNNWTAQTQANYNNEIQCYTDDESTDNRNYEVSDGSLKITARKQNIDCPGLNNVNRPWTSGRLNSKDKAEFLYGRVEARIRFLELKGGTWPAFWMLGNRISEQPYKGDNDNVNWPNPGAGEIDIWEWFSNDGDSYITNFFNTSDASCGVERRINYDGGAPSVMNFHTYAIEWTADNVTFFMDDKVVAEQDLSNCDQYEEPMFVLLNVAIGGNLGGALDPQLSTATMEVDYVAHCVATQANSWTSCNESTPLIIDDDNDGVRNDLDECANTPDGALVNDAGCEIPTAPVIQAPVPTSPASEVISLFSDSYSNIQSIDYNPNWGQGTQVSIVEIEGNTTLKYANLNYQGTDYGGNKQDVRGMAFLNLDYWTAVSTVLEIYLISPGPQETAFNINVTKHGWQSLQIPLSKFTNVDLSDTFQLKVVGNGTVFLDNIYFSTAQTAVADADGDSVPDAKDSCPNTRIGAQVDNNGCEVTTNSAPSVGLTVTQGSNAVTSISEDGGMVTVSATISDHNSGDTHSVAWTASGVTGTSSNGTDFTFNPSGLGGSQITVNAEVSDNGQPVLTGQASVSMTVTQAAPVFLPVPIETKSGGGALQIYYLCGLFIIAFIRRLRPS